MANMIRIRQKQNADGSEDKLSDAPIIDIDQDYRIRAHRLDLYTLAS